MKYKIEKKLSPLEIVDMIESTSIDDLRDLSRIAKGRLQTIASKKMKSTPCGVPIDKLVY
jgi:hypothetical protein